MLLRKRPTNKNMRKTKALKKKVSKIKTIKLKITNTPIVVHPKRKLKGKWAQLPSSKVITTLEIPKKVRKPSIEKMYFTKDTEDAIVAYNAETDHTKREHLYNTKIKFAFEKLVENIYNTFKFTYFEVGPIDVQRETVSHLVANIEKYEAGKGKAFSYFSIIAKNYLIFHNNSNYKRFNRHVDITENHEDHGVQLQTNDKHHDSKQNREFLDLVIGFWDINLTKVFKKQRDLCIAQSVIELFRNIDRIDSFNKKALYLYIREISSCKTQQITKVINKMKSQQKQITENYLNSGYLQTKTIRT